MKVENQFILEKSNERKTGALVGELGISDGSGRIGDRPGEYLEVSLCDGEIRRRGVRPRLSLLHHGDRASDSDRGADDRARDRAESHRGVRGPLPETVETGRFSRRTCSAFRDCAHHLLPDRLRSSGDDSRRGHSLRRLEGDRPDQRRHHAVPDSRLLRRGRRLDADLRSQGGHRKSRFQDRRRGAGGVSSDSGGRAGHMVVCDRRTACVHDAVRHHSLVRRQEGH